mmetsp:Transcript_137267/g.238721  ORF Transcript_137267/g.238721 Transcript_137267/m.238721 type:complete len:82 (+) Transcript_137267:2083-2328(+)
MGWGGALVTTAITKGANYISEEYAPLVHFERCLDSQENPPTPKSPTHPNVLSPCNMPYRCVHSVHMFTMGEAVIAVFVTYL